MNESEKQMTTKIFWSKEDNGYIAVDQARPGCSAWGTTKAKCMRQLANAQAAWNEAQRRAHTMRADITSPEPQPPHKREGELSMKPPFEEHASIPKLKEAAGLLRLERPDLALEIERAIDDLEELLADGQ